MPLDFKSLLCENGQSGTLWQTLSSAERLRYADLSNEQPGLIGQYYYGQNFQTLQNTVVDSQISFYWGTGAPDALPGRIDDFSIRWSGYLVPDTNETYTFFLGSDDGSRLYIDGQLIIDNWRNQAHNVQTATYRLRAGRYYNIVVEYYEATGGASVELEWSSNSVARQVIGGNNLRHGIEFRVYDSISSWQSDRARDLVDLDETESLEIRGQWSSTTESMSLSGWTTDPEHGIKITANSTSEGGYFWSDPERPAHKRFSPATGVAAYIENVSVRFENLHISAYTNNCVSISNSTEQKVEIVNCYIWQRNGTHSNIVIDSDPGSTTILSSIIEGGTTAVQSMSGQNNVVNCTITGAQNGVSTTADSVTVDSSVVFNNSINDWVGTFGQERIKNCASDDEPSVSTNWIDISPAGEAAGWTAAFYDWSSRDFRPRDTASVLYNSGNSAIVSGFYDQLKVPFVDVGFAPRETIDIGACSLTDWKDFRYRRRVAVSIPAADVDANLTDFPLYINLGSIPLSSSLWSEARIKELRISDKNRRSYPQETVFFDRNTNRGELWTKVNLSSTEDTEFYVYYGYEPTIQGLDEDVRPLDNVYGQYETWSDYEFVHHLQTFGQWIDSTENGRDGYIPPGLGWTAPTIELDGRFGNSQLFNGTTSAFSTGYIPTDASWTGITMEAWYRKNDASDERIMCCAEPASTNVAQHIYALHSGQPSTPNRISMRLATDTQVGTQLDGNTGFTYGQWQFSVGTWSSSDNLMQLFLNQNLDATGTKPGNRVRAIPANYRTVIAQLSEITAPQRYWGGGLDELRIAKFRFPNYAARVKAQYLNQTSEAFSQTQPETFNPVKPEPPAPPIEYNNSAFITNATNLTVPVQIESSAIATDRAVVALVSWRSTATLNWVRFNGVDMTLIGSHSTGGTGTNINQTAIYAINESQLPAAAGTYNGTAQLSANSNAAITFVYLDQINQTDIGYTSKTTTGSFFETEIDFTLEEPGQTAIDVLSLPVLGDTIVEEPGQTRIVDINWSGTSHSVSFKTFSEPGIGRLSWYNELVATRASNSVIILKTTTPIDYQYKADGKIRVFGSADYFLDYWEFYEGFGGIVLSYESDATNDRSLEIAREGYGSAYVAGTIIEPDQLEYIIIVIPEKAITFGGGDYFIVFNVVASGGITINGEVLEFDQVDITTDPDFGSILVSYDSDALEDRTIEFYWTASGSCTTSGENAIDDLEAITDPDFGSILVSYDSDPLEDRTIEFYYTAIDGIELSGEVENNQIELVPDLQYGIIFTFYDSDPHEDRSIIVYYSSTGSAFFSGTNDLDEVHLTTDPEFGRINLYYDSDALEDRTIEFEREAVVQPIFVNGLNDIDEAHLTTDPDFGSILVSYDSDPLEDRTIEFYWTAVPEAIQMLGDHNPIVLEIIFTMIGGILLQYSSDALEDRTIEFTRTAAGASTTNIEIEEADWIDLTTDPEFGAIELSYESDLLEDRTVELERDMSGGIYAGGTVPEADWIEVIYIVDPSGDPITIGGGDYSISFSREMSGGITVGGTVPSFDFVVLVTVIIDEPIKLSYSTQDNEVHLPKPSLSFGRALFKRITSAPFKLAWEHVPRIFRSIKIKGTTTAKVTATALFIYSGSGRILLRRVKAKYELSIEKYYTGSGRIRFLKIVRPTRIYSYYPIYTYDSVHGGFTLIGGLWFLSIKASIESGKIKLSGTSSIEDFKWNYKYKASGRIFCKRIVNRPTLHFEYASRTTRNVKVRGSIKKPVVIPSYIYTGTGLILIKQASIHRYKASGKITINGSVVTDEQTKSYKYKAYGRIFTRRMKNQYSLSIFVVVKRIRLRTKISYKRRLELNSSADYGTITTSIAHSSDFTIDRVSVGTITTSISSETEKSYGYIYASSGSIKTSIKAIYFSSIVYVPSGNITISGSADLSYAYTASGKITVYISSESSKTPGFVYKASGRIRIPRKKSAIVVLVRKPTVRGKIRTGGTAKHRAVYNWPNYNADGQLISRIASTYTHTNNYSYISEVEAITMSIKSDSEFYLIKEYSSSGKVNSIISSWHEWEPNYEFVAFGKIIARPVSIGLGRRDFSYKAKGNVTTKITGKTLRRTVIVRIANGAFIDRFNEDRTVKEPLAGTVFKYKV